MTDSSFQYFAIYKPHNMVSQFVSPHSVPLLSDLNYCFPTGTHAIGRLDKCSEGLLLLTTNPTITRLLFQATQPHQRKYFVQVTGNIAEESIEKLRNGILISDKNAGQYLTKPCKVKHITKPIWLNDSDYEVKSDFPNSWLEIELVEGRFHQIRKMVAAVNHKCRRLIRISIEKMHIDSMKPGEIREYNEAEFFELLGIG